jgi:S1-C subfamily serine protease
MATESPSLSVFSQQLADLVERASAFVVSVDGRPRRPSSGIVYGGDLVVTADHTIERDEDIRVVAGGEPRAATLAGRDAASDIAVLRVAGLASAEPPRSATLRTGMLAVSVARTRSGGVSAGLGIISAVGGPLRTGGGLVLPQVIRTDTAAAPGMSGGAIVDAGGRVIGMMTSALLRGLPVGIPSTQVWQIAAALASGKTMRRGYLGVSVQPVRLPERQGGGARGLLVFGVQPGGAAEAAGVLVGDIIVGLKDHSVTDADSLQDALADVEPGLKVPLAVLRGGAREQVTVAVGERPR